MDYLRLFLATIRQYSWLFIKKIFLIIQIMLLIFLFFVGILFFYFPPDEKLNIAGSIIFGAFFLIMSLYNLYELKSSGSINDGVIFLFMALPSVLTILVLFPDLILLKVIYTLVTLFTIWKANKVRQTSWISHLKCGFKEAE